MKRTTHAHRMLRALEWIQACFCVEIHFSAVFVRSQVSGSCSAAGERPSPKPARMPRWKCWFVFEELFFSAPSSILQCWAGVQVALGHGVLRWSDLQHSKDLTLAGGALMGITWRMKKRSVQVPWAALRIGISGRDWAFKWLEVLTYHGLPGKDFVILAPSHDLKSFKDAVAKFYHCQSMLRTLLLHSGFTASEAMTYSYHSWRHLFPTAGRQLQLSNATLNDMGHWAPNSGMPQRYDSAACVSELTGKATVRQAFQGNWSMVGRVAYHYWWLLKTLYLLNFLKKPKIQPDIVTNVLVPVVSGSVVSKPSTARAVEHHGQRRIHLWVWVHIHFAVYGNAVALLSQHFSRTLRMKVSWNSKI